MGTWAWESRSASLFGLIRPPTPRMAVNPVRLGGWSAKWPENGRLRTACYMSKVAVRDEHDMVMLGGLTAVSEVVYMRKAGVRDENYPLTTFYVRWVRFCV